MPFKNLFVYPKYPENLKRLFQLAYNLWCSWNYDAINLFYRIDAKRFREVNHNPVQFLLELPGERVEELAKDPGFLFELDEAWQKFQPETAPRHHYPRRGPGLEGEGGIPSNQ